MTLYTNIVKELVYVALCRIRSIEGLYIVTPDDDETKFKFYHNRVQATSTRKLLAEFKISKKPSNNKSESTHTFYKQQKRFFNHHL